MGRLSSPRSVHIKDFIARRLPHKKGFIVEGCPAGQGALDFPRFFAEPRRLPHNVSAILELWPSPEDSVEASIAKEDAWARESITFLRQYLSHEALLP